MAKGTVNIYPYRDINRKVLGKALAARFGGTWRVGTTNDEEKQQVHVQRLDQPIDAVDMQHVNQILNSHVFDPELR